MNLALPSGAMRLWSVLQKWAVILGILAGGGGLVFFKKVPWAESNGIPIQGFARLSESTRGSLRACFEITRSERLCTGEGAWEAFLLGEGAEFKIRSRYPIRFLSQRVLGGESDSGSDSKEEAVERTLDLPLVAHQNETHRFKKLAGDWLFLSHLWIERARVRIAKQVHSIWVRRVFLDLRMDPEWEEQVRLAGGVHVWNAAGIHLYALLFVLGSVGGAPRVHAGVLRVFLGAWILWLWGLSGGRDGLLRPWVLLGLRQWGGDRGGGWRFSALPLGVAVGVDELLAWALGFWSDFEGASWGMGRSHYFAAVLGGVWATGLGEKAEAGWRKHFRMALFSWLFVIPLDGFTHPKGFWLATGTPLISLVSVPLLAQVAYPFYAVTLLVPFSFWPLFPFDGQARFLELPGQWIDIGIDEMERLLRNPDISLGWAWVWIPPQGVVFGFLAGFLVSLLRLQLKARVGLIPFFWICGSQLFYETHEQKVRERVLQDPNCSTELSGWTIDGQLADVGQGDALWIRARQRGGKVRTLVVDTGSEKGSRSVRWVEHWVKGGAKRIDDLVFSHLDEDHSGKIVDLLEWVPIRTVWIPQAHLQRALGSSWYPKLSLFGVSLKTYQGFDSGSDLRVPGVRIWSEEAIASQKNSPNSGMGAILLECIQGERMYLGFGDAHAATELSWARQMREYFWTKKIKTRPLIWKATHHGSSAQNSLKTLELLEPREVWISSGSGNPYGHPGREFQARLGYYLNRSSDPFSVRIRRTDWEGALSFDSLSPGEGF